MKLTVKHIVFGVTTLALIVAASSIARCSYVNMENKERAAQEQEQIDTQHEEDNIETKTLDEDAHATLTDAQAELKANYTDEIKTTLQTLSHYVFVEQASGSTLSIDGDAITVDGTTHTGVISSWIGDAITGDITHMSQNSTPCTFSMLNEDGTTDLYLLYTTSTDKGLTFTIISSNTGEKSYLSQLKDDSLTLSGFDSFGTAIDTLQERVGTSTDALKEELTSYIKRAYPTATEAKITESIQIDKEQKTANFSLKLNDVAQTTLKVSWDYENNKVNVGDKHA